MLDSREPTAINNTYSLTMAREASGSTFNTLACSDLDLDGIVNHVASHIGRLLATSKFPWKIGKATSNFDLLSYKALTNSLAS